VGRRDINRPSLTAVAGGAAELLDRMVLQRFDRMRSIRLVCGLEAFPRDRLMTGHTAIGTTERRNPDLLKAARHSARLVTAQPLGDDTLEVVLIEAPFVLAIVDGEQHRARDEQQADARENGPVEAWVR
jgi:hypothetical protein